MKNCIRKSTVLVVLSGILLAVLPAKEIILGGKKGWPAFQSEENLARGKGRYGYECIQLDTNSFTVDENTDLLINFEALSNPVAYGDYELVTNNLKRSDQTQMGKFAGLSRNIGGLSILGQPGSFFGTEGLKGSFCIEFWLCPSVVENGEVIVNWESSKNVNNQLIYQMINASFVSGHIEWVFTDIFDASYTKSDLHEVLLKGTSKLVPQKWSYHVLSFDADTGLLEYKVNGITEDMRFMTDNGFENGEVCLVLMGTPSSLELCNEYTGEIDDFKISRSPYELPDFQSPEYAGKIEHTMYVPTGGKFVSKPILISDGSMLNSLNAEMNIPEQTEICFYVRSGDNYYGWTEDYPEWKPVTSGQQLKGVTGLYFQIAVELLPDGDGKSSPTLTQITLDYTELPEPLPPFIVKAVAGNGSVTVSWSYSVDDTVGGYYLYYGSRPGEYLGRFAVEGDSPINVGAVNSYTITGLENGRIYYFAVAAWSAFDDRIVGNLSKEVFARPLGRY